MREKERGSMGHPSRQKVRCGRNLFSVSKGGILNAEMGTAMIENRHSPIKPKEPDRKCECQSPKMMDHGVVIMVINGTAEF